jgi:hypothetical protein
VDASPEPTPEDRRGRRVLILTSVASVVVMGGLVALAMTGAGSGGDAQATVAPHAVTPFSRAVTFPPGCTPDRERPPRLVVDLPPEGLDFGDVKQGAVIEKVVPFRNAGLGPLCINDPDSGCSCAKAVIRGDKRRYESGEEGAFLITLRTEGHSDKQNRSFSVATNEIETPRHTYMVKAMISLGVMVDPNQLGFGEARKNQPAKATVRLTSPAADAPWKITDVVAVKLPTEDAPAYTWEVTPIEDPTRVKQGFTLVVTHPGREKEGGFQGQVVIKTTHPDRPEIPLFAYLSVRAPVTASPGAATFGFVQNGSPTNPWDIALFPATKDVVFQVLGLKIEPAPGQPERPEGAGFVANVDKNSKGTTVVRVRYDGKLRKAGLIEATLVIALDLPDQKEIRVPLRATLAELKPQPQKR